MSLKKKDIKNLTGGVSEQPHSQRFDSQCEEQKNFLSDAIKGLVKDLVQISYPIFNQPRMVLLDLSITLMYWTPSTFSFIQSKEMIMKNSCL